MLRTVLATVLASLAGPALAASHAYTIADQVMLDRVSKPRLAPNAQTLVFQLRETDLDHDRGVASLWRLDRGDEPGEAKRLTAPALGASEPAWSPSGDAIYFLAGKNGRQQLWRIPADGGRPKALSELPLDIEQFTLSADGRQVALLLRVFADCGDLACTRARLDEAAKRPAGGKLYERLFVRHWDTWSDGRTKQLFVASLKGDSLGELRPLTRTLDADVEEPAFSPDGRHLAFSARLKAGEPWSTNFDIYEVATGGKTEPVNLTRTHAAWDAGPVYAPGGQTLYYRAMRRPGFEADRFAIMARDLDHGQTRELAASWDHSALSLRVAADGRTLYTTADIRGQRALFAIDPASQNVERLTGEGTVGDFDLGAGHTVYTLDTLGAPAQIFGLIDGAAKPLTALNQARLSEIRFGDYEPFECAGAGGATVHGYVLRPVGFEPGKRYPVAFIIHGGPQGSMGNHFHYRWNPQTYAGAGYAVVFIDFHGSTGYGQAFTDSISRDWGGKPLEDLQKGWAYALETYDFLDADRACALGASYGGYMINWIASQWRGAFDCLVNHDGIFDMRSMYYATEELWFPEWENGGPYHEVPAAYERFNPANHVSDWDTPMLVIHGALDYRVPLEQGLATFTALQRRGIPSQFLYFPDENHWVLKPHNSMLWHETVEAWLDRWTDKR